MIIEVRSVQTKVDKSSQTEKHEIHLEELLMQREKIRELEVKIQEIKQLEETRKTSSLVVQTSSDIIPLSGYNNYRLIS